MATKIMLVRHGEKPVKKEKVFGVDLRGEQNKKELSTRGWQRSGAMVRLFNPVNGSFAHRALARPNAIFAADPEGGTKSERARNTVIGVAQSLGVKINVSFDKGEEKKLVKEVLSRPGVVLIGWEHKAIIEIANLILGNKKTCPQKWPGKRFDVVWVLDKQAGGKGWKLTQVPQMLLPGDSTKIL